MQKIVKVTLFLMVGVSSVLIYGVGESEEQNIIDFEKLQKSLDEYGKNVAKRCCKLPNASEYACARISQFYAVAAAIAKKDKRKIESIKREIEELPSLEALKICRNKNKAPDWSPMYQSTLLKFFGENDCYAQSIMSRAEEQKMLEQNYLTCMGIKRSSSGFYWRSALEKEVMDGSVDPIKAGTCFRTAFAIQAIYNLSG